ncbi:hypothetical protein [Sphingomonas aracearum]|uniref:hypothetical protein n=1 Tax=Sphingomonas aracearum TaxID=2283317 RepID=UPI0015F05CAD|nr:hypothetical protein [Sphingomonas aracearum]
MVVPFVVVEADVQAAGGQWLLSRISAATAACRASTISAGTGRPEAVHASAVAMAVL